MNLKLAENLIDYIQKEKSWRFKELLNFKSRAVSVKGVDQNSLFKLGVCLVYSHWEGFIKNSSVALFDHLIKKGYRYTQLKDNYKVCAFFDHFDGQYPHKNFRANLIIAKNEINFSKSINIDTNRYIDTKSNLNYEVLEEILYKIGLDKSYFELKANFLNEILVKERNAIAHGEYRKINISDFNLIYESTLNLMDTFCNLIENFIVQKEFLK